MQATRILAIRHGETPWNVDARIQGHTDIALNATGQRQAQLLAAALGAGEPIDAICASDLQRAHATAQAIGQACGLPVHTHTGLRERHFGDFQGRRFADVQVTDPLQAESWRTRVPDWCPPGGGESLLALRQRVCAAIDALAAAHIGQHLCIVTHGGVLDALYRAATGLAPQAPRTWLLPNTAINRLLWTPQGLSLVGWADTAHLDTLGRDETGL